MTSHNEEAYSQVDLNKAWDYFALLLHLHSLVLNPFLVRGEPTMVQMK
jgi:hypothetical protein